MFVLSTYFYAQWANSKKKNGNFGKPHIVLTEKGCTYRLCLFDFDYSTTTFFLSQCALYKASPNNKACFLVLIRTKSFVNF